MDISIVFEKMVMLFVVMLFGYAAVKCKVFDEKANINFSSLVVNITMPALIIGSLAGSGDLGNKADAILMLAVSTGMFVVAGVFAYLLAKICHIKKEEAGIIRFLTIFPNNAFMGFPVIEAIFGSEALLFASIINLPVNFLVYTYGIRLIAGRKKKSGTAWREMFNPGVVASVLAIIFYLADISLPPLAADIFQTVGSITTPLAMIILGASLAEISVLAAVKDLKIYAFSVIRLAVIPFLTWLITFKIFNQPVLTGILVVTMGMPCATVSVMLCNEYGKPSGTASKYVFMTTVLSIITIPVLAYLLFQI